MSVSPAEGSQQRQLQAEANGKRKRAPARSRSRSHDEEDLHTGLPPDSSFQQGDGKFLNCMEHRNCFAASTGKALCWRP